MRVLTFVVALLTASSAFAQTDPHETIAQQLEQLAAQVRAMMPPQAPPPPTITVPAGGDVQAVLNAAAAGSIVQLEAGARYVKALRLPARTGAPITITTAGALPDRRITPADLPLLATIATDSLEPAVYCTNSSGWRIVGVNLEGPTAGGREIAAIHDCDDVTFDRVLMVAGANGQRRGIRGNGTRITLTRSHIANIWEVGADSQAFCAWDGAGPFTITDNYLEAASENVMFGGSDSSAPERIPADILVEGNYFYEPLAWKNTGKNIKNLFELKAALRVTVRNNVFENNWTDGQSGWAIVFTPRNQYGAAVWTRVEDVLFEGNVVKGSSSGVNILGTDDERPSGKVARITLRHNLWLLTNSFLLVGGEAGAITIDHNTIVGVRWNLGTLTLGDVWDNGVKRPATYAVESLTWTNNLQEHGEYGLHADAGGIGTSALTSHTLAWTWTHNVLANGTGYSYPNVNWKPATADYLAAFDANWALIAGHPYQTADQTGGPLGR